MGHVPHVYVPGPWPAGPLDLPERTVRHLSRVLRVAAGEAVSYTDGAGRIGRGAFAGDGITRGDEQVVARPTPALTMAVAPPAGTERARFVVEKLAELGVDRLRWLRSRHGEGRPPRADKAAAWAAGALSQSRGAYLLEIDGPVGWGDLDAPLLVATPGDDPPPAVVGPVTAVVGPEAGFAAGEIAAGAVTAGLGPRILRVETAAIALATLLLASSGRLQEPFRRIFED